MSRFVGLGLITAVCLAAALPAAAQDFDSLFNAYLAGYWQANPGLATRAGVHTYDGVLPDFSPLAVQAEIARNRQFLFRFEQMSAASKLLAQRADLDVVLNHIRLTLLALEELRVLKTRPDLVVSALSDSVRDLTVREFAAADRRFEAADSRLRQLPKALTALRANFLASAAGAPPVRGAGVAAVTGSAARAGSGETALQTPSEYATRAAIARSQAAAAFIERTLPESAAQQGVGRKLQQRIQRDSVAAAAAFRDFARWLETTLLPASRAPAFPAADTYTRRFRYYLAVEEQPAGLLKAAEADLAATREQLRQVAEGLAPGRAAGELLETLAADHPRPNELLGAYQAAVAQVRRFVAEKKLAPLPRPERLRVERAPAGFPPDMVTLDLPGPFAPDLIFRLYVPNIDRMGVEAGDRVLAENGAAWIALVAVHETFPGHYAQLDLMNRAGNLAKKAFANPAFVAGWAHYCEQMMLEEGFSNEPPLQPGAPNPGAPGTPVLRLFQLLRAVRAQAAAVADIRLNTGAIAAGDAVQFLVEQALLPKDRAEEQVRAIALNPAALAADYAGKRGILRLREELRQKQGPAFILSEFHEQLISLGAPPLPAAREILLDALNRLGK